VFCVVSIARVRNEFSSSIIVIAICLPSLMFIPFAFRFWNFIIYAYPIVEEIRESDAYRDISLASALHMIVFNQDLIPRPEVSRRRSSRWGSNPNNRTNPLTEPNIDVNVDLEANVNVNDSPGLITRSLVRVGTRSAEISHVSVDGVRTVFRSASSSILLGPETNPVSRRPVSVSFDYTADEHRNFIHQKREEDEERSTADENRDSILDKEEDEED